MENNKISISLTTIIIIAVIGSLLLGLISFVIYNITKPQNDSFVASNDNNPRIESHSLIEIVETENDTQNSKDTENSSNNMTAQSSTTGKTSSRQSPASIGNWSIASKYASGGYVDVPVSVTKVTRGTSATKEVKNYCESGSSIYKYKDAEKGMEWAVIEYKVDLTKMEKDSTIVLDSRITGTGDNTSIKYNNYIYITATGYTKGEIVTCKFATQLPVGCTDYLIVLGSPFGSQAFFTGK